MLKTLYPFFFYVVLVGCSEPREPARSFQVAAMGLNAAAIADSGEHGIIGSVHHGISLWRIADQERLYNWHHKSQLDTTMIAADFSPEGNWALTADIHTLALWNARTGAALRFWQAPGDIQSVKLGPSGNSALLGLSNHTAVLFDVRKGGIVRTLHHQNGVRSVAISDDGRTALTGSDDYTATAWDLSTGKALSKVRHNDEVQLVALSADGELALSVSKYDRALLWSTADGATLAEVPLAAERLKRGLRFTAARFSKDKRWLLTGRPDRIVTLWQVPEQAQTTFAPIAQWQIPTKNSWKPTGVAILDVAFGVSEQQFFAVGSNGFIYELQRP